MCAGDKEVFDGIEKTGLAAVGKASFYLGDVGRASRMKLAVNMVMGQVFNRRSTIPPPHRSHSTVSVVSWSSFGDGISTDKTWMFKLAMF